MESQNIYQLSWVSRKYFPESLMDYKLYCTLLTVAAGPETLSAATHGHSPGPIALAATQSGDMTCLISVAHQSKESWNQAFVLVFLCRLLTNNIG